MQPDDLKEFFDEKLKSLRELADERDKRYAAESTADKIAVDKALTAVKDATNAAFAASDKAITKAEAAQKVYDIGHNDLIRKGEEQIRNLRTEFMERIADLRETRSLNEGDKAGRLSTRELIGWAIAVIGGGGAIVLALGKHAAN